MMFERTNEATEGFIANPILQVAAASLRQVVTQIRMPSLPARSPQQFHELGLPKDLADADAYVLNALPTAVWGQCMLGLDFMSGLSATIATDSYFSGHVIARSALESFAFAYWVCDERCSVNASYLRSLQLNKSLVNYERKRWMHQNKPSSASHHHEVFDQRIRFIDRAIAHFEERLESSEKTQEHTVPSKSGAVNQILRDLTPISEGIYSRLSDVVHGDLMFAQSLLSPHPDEACVAKTGKPVQLSTTIANHLIPAWHAIAAMHRAVSIAKCTLEIHCDIDEITELLSDVQGFILHNGNEPIWYKSDTLVDEEGIQALDWYLEKKGLTRPKPS